MVVNHVDGLGPVSKLYVGGDAEVLAAATNGGLRCHVLLLGVLLCVWPGQGIGLQLDVASQQVLAGATDVCQVSSE
jgi:hypothetical protein